jgi:hypothetical protein
MITVSNPKVAGFVPEWAPFRGFSILFDNPGESVRPTERYELLACDVDSDPALGFYCALRDALASLDVRLLTHAYLFCPLPPASYHVTVWDGANDGNAQSVVPEHREPIRHLLAELPATLRETSPLLQTVCESALVTRHDWNLSFRYSRLSLVGQSVLVTELEPATPEDAERRSQRSPFRTDVDGVPDGVARGGRRKAPRLSS